MRSTPRERPARWGVDVAVGAWVLLWVAVGVTVADRLDDLAELAGTLETAAGALDETADGLDRLSGVPFVGGDIEDVADSVADTAAEARADARRARLAVGGLAWLVGAAVAAGPIGPVVLLWAGWRTGWVRRALLAPGREGIRGRDRPDDDGRGPSR